MNTNDSAAPQPGMPQTGEACNKPFDCPMCGRCIKAVSDVCEPCVTAFHIVESVNRFNRAYYSYRRLQPKE